MHPISVRWTGAPPRVSVWPLCLHNKKSADPLGHSYMDEHSSTDLTLSLNCTVFVNFLHVLNAASKNFAVFGFSRFLGFSVFQNYRLGTCTTKTIFFHTLYLKFFKRVKTVPLVKLVTSDEVVVVRCCSTLCNLCVFSVAF